MCALITAETTNNEHVCGILFITNNNKIFRVPFRDLVTRLLLLFVCYYTYVYNDYSLF